jgi:hypothetical protein
MRLGELEQRLALDTEQRDAGGRGLVCTMNKRSVATVCNDWVRAFVRLTLRALALQAIDVYLDIHPYTTAYCLPSGLQAQSYTAPSTANGTRIASPSADNIYKPVSP